MREALRTGNGHGMEILTVLRDGDRRLTRWMAAWDSGWARRGLPPVEAAAERTKLWWAAAVVMAAGADGVAARPQSLGSRAWRWQNCCRTAL